MNCVSELNKLENNKIKYISDLIKKEDIDEWIPNDIVFIESPTGSGKSHFIKHVLSKYESNKKILLLVNRTIIKNQSKKELTKDEVIDNITITTYQNLTTKILTKDTKNYIDFDYIICDEAHFYCEESMFIFNTDVSFEWVLKQNQAIKIFMTATADFIKDYLETVLGLEVYYYFIKPDYKFIDKFYFYKDDDVIKKLLIELPKDEKAIYFTSAKKAYETSQILESCAFYCSENNYRYNQYSNSETMSSIENKEMFEEQVLCTTKVMDCGVNIKDLNVKHLIIDIADISSIIQCIGRKRFTNDSEKINIYIKDKKGNALMRKIESINKKLENANILLLEGAEKLIEENAHQNTYGNLIYDVINRETLQIEKKVNDLMYYTYTENKDIYYNMMNDVENGFKNKLFERMGINMNYKFIEEEVDSLRLDDILNRFVGVKMFEEEQRVFKDFITKELFNTAKTNHGSIGLKTINSFFEENEIEFVIESKKDKRRKLEDGRENPNRDKRYWIIAKKIYEQQ